MLGGVTLGKFSFDRIIRKTLSSDPASAGIYGLVDTARDPRLYGLLLRPGTTTRCILGSTLPDDLRRVAPYVVPLHERDQPLRAAWRDRGRNQAWGVIAISDQPLEVVANHFQTMRAVKLENGTSAVFRFFDPRVLRAFLPTCSAEQLRQFFGPIEAMVCEQADGRWLTYTCQDGRLNQREATQDELP